MPPLASGVIRKYRWVSFSWKTSITYKTNYFYSMLPYFESRRTSLSWSSSCRHFSDFLNYLIATSWKENGELFAEVGVFLSPPYTIPKPPRPKNWLLFILYYEVLPLIIRSASLLHSSYSSFRFSSSFLSAYIIRVNSTCYTYNLLWTLLKSSIFKSGK